MQFLDLLPVDTHLLQERYSLNVLIGHALCRTDLLLNRVNSAEVGLLDLASHPVAPVDLVMDMILPQLETSVTGIIHGWVGNPSLYNLMNGSV